MGGKKLKDVAEFSSRDQKLWSLPCHGQRGQLYLSINISNHFMLQLSSPKLRTNVNMRFVSLEHLRIAPEALDSLLPQGKLDGIESIADTRRVACCPKQRRERSEGSGHGESGN